MGYSLLTPTLQYSSKEQPVMSMIEFNSLLGVLHRLSVPLRANAQLLTMAYKVLYILGPFVCLLLSPITLFGFFSLL